MDNSFQHVLMPYYRLSKYRHTNVHIAGTTKKRARDITMAPPLASSRLLVVYGSIDLSFISRCQVAQPTRERGCNSLGDVIGLGLIPRHQVA